MTTSRESERVLQNIIDLAIRHVDITASYRHFLLFGDIKVIWKEGKNPIQIKNKRWEDEKKN